jgi:hypothetical protein
MCIQCLGHFSPVTPWPLSFLCSLPLPTYPLTTRQKLFYPYL